MQWKSKVFLSYIFFAGEYEQSIEIVFRTDPNHPVDNFNLLKRTSIGWVGIKDALEDTKAKEIIGKNFNNIVGCVCHY